MNQNGMFRATPNDVLKSKAMIRLCFINDVKFRGIDLVPKEVRRGGIR